VTIESAAVSNIWSWKAGEASQGHAITSGETPMSEVVETANGKLVVNGPDRLWMMNADGSQLSLFAEVDAGNIATCGDSVLADVVLNGLRHILLLGPDGTRTASLASGNLFSPICSPDRRFVYYVDLNPPQRILRVPIGGGASVEIRLSTASPVRTATDLGEGSPWAATATSTAPPSRAAITVTGLFSRSPRRGR
jgi:hypothetical protein